MKHFLTFVLLVSLCGSAFGQDSLGVRKISSIFDNWDNVDDVAFTGDYAVIATGSSGFRIVSLTGDNAPQIVSGDQANPNGAYEVRIDENRAYVSTSEFIRIYDISDPFNPIQIGEYDAQFPINSYEVKNNLLLINVTNQHTGRLDRVEIFDVSNPANIDSIGFFQLPRNARNAHFEYMKVEGNRVYYGAGTGRFGILDISDPTAPVELDYLDLVFLGGLTLHGDILCLYQYTGWLQGLNIYNVEDPRQIERIAHFDSLTASSFMLFDNIGFARTFGSPGYSAFDLSDPIHPTLITTLETDPDLYFRGISGSKLLAITSNHPTLTVFEIGEQGQIEEVGRSVNHGRVEDVIVSGNLAVVGVDRGIALIDVSNPASPRELSYFSYNRLHLSTRYPLYMVGTSLFVPYSITAQGANRGCKTFDLSDPLHPIEVKDDSMSVVDSMRIYFGVQTRGFIAFALSSPRGLVILDYSDPLDPVELGCFEAVGPTAVCFDGDLAYLTSRLDATHLRITTINISDLADPIELGHLDTAYFSVRELAANDGNVYLLATVSVRSFNFSDPAHPIYIGRYDLPTQSEGGIKMIDSGHLAVGNGSSGIRIFNTRDELGRGGRLRESGYFNTPGYVEKVFVRGNLAFVADRTNLGVYDISEAIGWEGVALEHQRLPVKATLNAYPTPSTPLQPSHIPLLTAQTSI